MSTMVATVPLLSHGWDRIWSDTYPLYTLRSSVFGLIQAFDSSLTLPMSHYMYDEWLDKVRIGFHYV